LPNMDEVVRKVRYRIGMIEGGNAPGGVPITIPELLLLIEEREQFKMERMRLLQTIELRDESIKAMERTLEHDYEEMQKQSRKVAEQDKEIAQHIKGIKIIQDAAIDMNLLPQQALNVIHGTATQLLLKINL
jgi:hypothetical protein